MFPHLQAPRQSNRAEVLQTFPRRNSVGWAAGWSKNIRVNAIGQAWAK